MTNHQAQALLKRFEIALITYYKAGKDWTSDQIKECAICENDLIAALTVTDLEQTFLRLAQAMNSQTLPRTKIEVSVDI